MGFHLKGPELEVKVHLLLVLIMFTTAILCFLEMRYPNSALLSFARAASVFFQGTWFIQIGHILYAGDPAWDIHEMGGPMFAPVVFCMHMMLIATGYLVVFIGMYWCFSKYGSLGLDEGDTSHADAETKQELAVLIAKDYSD